jgi:hypothetical protein
MTRRYVVGAAVFATAWAAFSARVIARYSWRDQLDADLSIAVLALLLLLYLYCTPRSQG